MKTQLSLRKEMKEYKGIKKKPAHKTTLLKEGGPTKSL